MQELRLIGVSEDGSGLLLADDDGGRFTLPITDELRTTIRRDRREPASADGQAKAENPLRPRDVQGLIRGGVPLEEIAERAGWTLEKVQRYEGPIRAERDYVSGLAQGVQLYGRGETTTLRERADRRLAERGVEAERVVWDSWKNDDAHWTVTVRFPAGGRQREATWLFDPVNRALRTVDDEARWLGGDEIAAADEEAPERQKAVARKKAGGSARAARPASVYDVEAEGGLEDAQAPHLGATLGSSDDAGKPADLTASMRARQASRSRSKGSGRSNASRPTALPNVTSGSPDVTRVERLDLGTTPPPAPSHPRPEELHARSDSDADNANTNANAEKNDDTTRRATAGVTALPTHKTADAPTADEPDVDVHAADESDDVAAEKSTSTGSRRRKSRRSRANLEQASVRAALHDDDAEQDESLFGELPGFHDGGDVHQLHDVEDDAFDEANLDEADDVAEADVEDAVDDGAETKAAGSAAADDEVVQEESLFDEVDEPAEASAPAKKSTQKRTSVPERASQSRKSSRPSVPSWDDIMFGGRGPKK
ncbi:septation protein SepH [Dermacoccus abyssi]|uniref:septation protein SepH n=1 Tax=Dermacoccus abyssi TaxID=322596 RepID=UPI0021A292E4|nr:septation protein SepH [Dermacoccus abyssi]